MRGLLALEEHSVGCTGQAGASTVGMSSTVWIDGGQARRTALGCLRVGARARGSHTGAHQLHRMHTSPGLGPSSARTCNGQAIWPLKTKAATVGLLYHIQVLYGLPHLRVGDGTQWQSSANSSQAPGTALRWRGGASECAEPECASIARTTSTKERCAVVCRDEHCWARRELTAQCTWQHSSWGQPCAHPQLLVQHPKTRAPSTCD